MSLPCAVGVDGVEVLIDEGDLAVRFQRQPACILSRRAVQAENGKHGRADEQGKPDHGTAIYEKLARGHSIILWIWFESFKMAWRQLRTSRTAHSADRNDLVK